MLPEYEQCKMLAAANILIQEAAITTGRHILKARLSKEGCLVLESASEEYADESVDADTIREHAAMVLRGLRVHPEHVQEHEGADDTPVFHVPLDVINRECVKDILFEAECGADLGRYFTRAQGDPHKAARDAFFDPPSLPRAWITGATRLPACGLGDPTPPLEDESALYEAYAALREKVAQLIKEQKLDVSVDALLDPVPDIHGGILRFNLIGMKNNARLLSRAAGRIYEQKSQQGHRDFKARQAVELQHVPAQLHGMLKALDYPVAPLEDNGIERSDPNAYRVQLTQPMGEGRIKALEVMLNAALSHFSAAASAFEPDAVSYQAHVQATGTPHEAPVGWVKRIMGGKGEPQFEALGLIVVKIRREHVGDDYGTRALPTIEEMKEIGSYLAAFDWKKLAATKQDPSVKRSDGRG